jgi:hypothetical protein
MLRYTHIAYMLLVSNDISLYLVVSKMFWTDAVKIIKLTIRPIGRHQPGSSSLSHVDTVLTFSSIFGTLTEVLFCQSVKHSLRFGLDLLNGVKPASFQLNLLAPEFFNFFSTPVCKM